MSNESIKSFLRQLGAGVAASGPHLVLCAIFFFPVIFGGEIFAFRDGAHFYAPLFKYIQSELAQGRFPLWNPYENLGTPLFANPVSSVLYPGKLVFFLPFAFEKTYAIYICGHIFLASMGMYRLARHWHCSRVGANFAAIVYVFGGSVLYQHLNVIFLIGAAWIPIAIQLADEMLRCGPGSQRKGVLLGIVATLIILGGDVQGAFNLGLIVLLLAALRLKRRKIPTILGNLTLAVIVAGLLSAIQTIPAYEFARQSDRADPVEGKSSFQEHFLAQDVEKPGHERNRYLFSVGPWRFAEYVWPNAGGRQFPKNTRWFAAISWDDYVWVPSLYCGIVPFIFITVAFFSKKRHQRGDRTTKWLWTVLIICLLGSLGYFGLGWLFGQILILAGKDPERLTVGNPFGGVYWLINMVVHGYSQFRYPAKLLTLAAVPFSLLAAKGFDLAFRNSLAAKKFRRKTVVMSLFLLVATTILAVIGRPNSGLWEWVAERTPECPMFGLFQMNLAEIEFIFTISQSIFILVSFLLILNTRKLDKKNKNFAKTTLLVLLAADLYFANGWMVPTALPPPQSTKSFPVVSPNDQNAPPRIYRYPNLANSRFSREPSANRFAESLAWDMGSLHPKYNLELELALLDVRGTMLLAEHARLLREVRELGGRFDEVLNETGYEYVILPNHLSLNQETFERIDKTVAELPEEVVLWRLKQTTPRVWIESNGNSIAKIVDYRPERVEIELETDQAGAVLVLTDAWYPSWTAKIDGHAGPEIVRHKGLYRSITLEQSGKQTVVFEYQPKSFAIGAIFTISGMIIVIVVLFWSRLAACPRLYFYKRGVE